MTSRFSSECSGGSQREKKEGEVKGPRSPAHLSSPARPMALDSAGVSVRAMTAKWETEIRNIQRGRQKRTGKSGRRSGAAGSATGLWEERHTLARLKDKLETRDGRLLLRLENEEWQVSPVGRMPPNVGIRCPLCSLADIHDTALPRTLGNETESNLSDVCGRLIAGLLVTPTATTGDQKTGDQKTGDQKTDDQKTGDKTR
ncbi:leucine-rich repeat-containing protein 39 isoform X1 [Stigmatopora argus]